MSTSTSPRRPAYRATHLAALLALCGAFALPLGAHAQVQAFGNAAVVNGTPISMERLELSYEEYLRERRVNVGAMRNPNSAKRFKRETLDLLVDQELLWQEARRLKLEATPQEADQAIAGLRSAFKTPQDFEARVAAEGYTAKGYAEHVRRLLSAQKVMDRAAASVTVNDADIHAFYEKHKARFERPEQLKLRHIYLPFADGAGEPQKEALRVQARELLAKARRGGDFAALAREHSKGSSAAQGGELGFVARADLAEPLGDAAFAVPVGGVTEVVELADGLHLLKVDERRAAEPIPESAGRDGIREHLQRQRIQEAHDATLGRLRAAAKIDIVAPLPPVASIADEKTSPTQRARETVP